AVRDRRGAGPRAVGRHGADRPARRPPAAGLRGHGRLRGRPVRRPVLGGEVGVVRVLVGPDTDDLAELYAAPADPWLRVNMVATVDGAATGETGRSGSINNAVDKLVYDQLRALADAIVVGAGTARIEGYAPEARPT